MRLQSTLSWADRLTLIREYQLQPTEACTAFGVNEGQLKAAIKLQSRGIFDTNDSLNPEVFREYFTKLRSGEFTGNSTKTFRPKTSRPSKIVDAFKSITEAPQPVDEVISRFGISLAVLRQSKRFDKSDTPGTIRIRKDKDSGQMMVWRDLGAKQ